MEKIKLVHIVEAFGGGIYTYLKNLSVHLDQKNKNVQNIIIYSPNRKEINPDSFKSDFPSNTIFYEVNMTRNISLFNDIQASRKLISFIKKIKPDIIHLHSSKAGIIGRIAAKFSNSKNVFYSPHGYSFNRKDISVLKRNIFKTIEFLANSILGGTTIACGDTEYELSKKIGKSVLNRNGVNIDEISKHKQSPPKNNPLKIGIVGRITEARNPELFNRIALKFNNYDFYWVGSGELTELITAKNIKITGWIQSPEEIYAHVNNLDIYIHTSLWEGLPIAILEAMTLKKPVIATNVIGNKDAVDHKETGFLFDDIQELDKYFNYLSTEKNRELMGEKGFKRCEAYFSNEKNFKTLTDIYLNTI